jgi:hydroxypyruvate reductase
MTHTELKQKARTIFDAAVQSVQAQNLVRHKMRKHGQVLHLQDLPLELDRYRRILVAGAGKAASQIARGLEDLLEDRITAGAIVTKDGHGVPLRRITVLEAAHPVPDTRSLQAGRAIAELADAAGPEDLFLFALTGGASSLMELPSEGISLEDLQKTTRTLLQAGADINAVNSVRGCLSGIKSGGLARIAAPSHVVCLVLSDVLGNPLDVIGSGPCLPSSRRPEEALKVLEKYGGMDAFPKSVVRLIETLQPADPPQNRIEHVILGDLDTAIDAACLEAERQGFEAVVQNRRVVGEARSFGQTAALEAQQTHSSCTHPTCLVWGGETTVTVTGSGLGGRNQEAAAQAALTMAESRNIVVLAAGTDGTDGPTDAAGGVVDGTTAHLASRAGRPLNSALENNDTYPALAAAGALVMTGPTGTNVGDITLALILPQNGA